MSDRTLKGLLLEMKLSDNIEDRVLAEEHIVIMFEDERAKNQRLLAVLDEINGYWGACGENAEHPSGFGLSEYTEQAIEEYKGSE